MTGPRPFVILAAALILLAGGVLAGWVANEEFGTEENSESRSPANNRLRELEDLEGARTIRLLEDLCRAGTRLRSAYTGKTIGHAERCEGGSGDNIEALIAAICMDVRKAAYTAHLREGDCEP
jgi:hypothetical protein